MTYYIISGKSLYNGYHEYLGQDECNMYTTGFISDALLFSHIEGPTYYIDENKQQLKNLFEDIMITELQIAEVSHRPVKLD